MKIQESTFNSHEIESFLGNIDQKFAQKCFKEDFIQKLKKDRITRTEAENWFKRYFPANYSQYYFRLMESHCSQFSEIINN